MCQAHLASVSSECFWCGGGYLAGLDNYISHDKDCPAITGNEAMKQEIIENRRKTEREKINMID